MTSVPQSGTSPRMAIICQLTKVAGLLSYCLAVCHGFSAIWARCQMAAAALSRKLSAYRHSLYALCSQRLFAAYYGVGHAPDLYPDLEAARRRNLPRDQGESVHGALGYLRRLGCMAGVVLVMLIMSHVPRVNGGIFDPTRIFTLNGGTGMTPAPIVLFSGGVSFLEKSILAFVNARWTALISSFPSPSGINIPKGAAPGYAMALTSTSHGACANRYSNCPANNIDSGSNIIYVSCIGWCGGNLLNSSCNFLNWSCFNDRQAAACSIHDARCLSASIWAAWTRLIFSSYTSSQSVNIGSIITPAKTQIAPQVHSLESFSIPIPTSALPNVAPPSKSRCGQSLNTASSASILMALIASSGGFFALACLAWVIIRKLRGVS